jgi:hypothetical protein
MNYKVGDVERKRGKKDYYTWSQREKKKTREIKLKKKAFIKWIISLDENFVMSHNLSRHKQQLLEHSESSKLLVKFETHKQTQQQQKILNAVHSLARLNTTHICRLDWLCRFDVLFF